MDDGLDATGALAVEAHVAACPRCLAMTPVFVRATDAVTPVAAPPAAEAPAAGTSSIWKWWFAPLAAGAVATLIWMVVPQQQQIATAPFVPPPATERPASRAMEPPANAVAAAPPQ